MADENPSVRRAIRIYQALLCLYPSSHRREYGPWMIQLFRDQCRDASAGRRAPPELWIRTLADVVFSATREQLTQPMHRMKNMSSNQLSWLLFAVATGAGILSCAFIPGRLDLALGLAWCCALVLALRAIVEWKRPENELIPSLVSGALIAVLFGLILPIWGAEGGIKNWHATTLRLPIIPALIPIPILLNGFVPVFRVGLRLARQRP